MVSRSEIPEALASISTATLSTVLLKMGLRNVAMRGPRPLKPQQGRRWGRAFTLRFVPAREELATLKSLGCLAAADRLRRGGGVSR